VSRLSVAGNDIMGTLVFDRWARISCPGCGREREEIGTTQRVAQASALL
jgi:hypothetical protein